MSLGYPDGKRFAFTVFDDTDSGTIETVGPVYDLLEELGILVTKSVWVYPSRGSFSGGFLEDSEYLQWVRSLLKAGFEIGLHNVGDGDFSREEILHGLDRYRLLLGKPPRVHTNHVSNPDNLYWWGKRFGWPLGDAYRIAFRLLTGTRALHDGGEDPSGDRFWGDAAIDHELYVRNLVFNRINTLRADPKMPYHVDAKPWVHRWFSSSDGHNCRVFTDLIQPRHVDRLEREHGTCIVYTHFGDGFVDANGRVDPDFEEHIRYLAAKQTAWFAPVSTVLDFLAQSNEPTDPGARYLAALDARWVIDRVSKMARYRL